MKFNNCDFVHTHSHTDGMCNVKEFALKAREMGFPALAITDHGNIGGWIKFIKECSATKDKKDNPIPFKPIKPILGCEFYLCRHREYKNKELQPDGRKGNRHLILHAKNWKGYQNLCSLSQESWVDGFYSNPRIDLELLEKYHEGLICQTACLSSIVNANLLAGRYDKAKRICSIFKDMFKEDLFLEVQYHGIDSERIIIPDIIKLSKELNLLMVCSNDSHYLEKSHAKSHEVLLCMSSSRCLSDPKHLSFPYDEFYMKSADEMGKMFGDIPQCIYNTIALAERINSDDINKNLFGGMRLPDIDIPKEFETNVKFEGQYNYIVKLAQDGMKAKGWDKSQKHIDQLNKELNDIRVAWENNGYDFATYFLIEYTIINEAKKRGILTGPGRGSGFASVLLHCLGIAYGCDPINYDLIWERFLGFDHKKFIKESDFGFKDESYDIGNIQDTTEEENEEINQVLEGDEEEL